MAWTFPNQSCNLVAGVQRKTRRFGLEYTENKSTFCPLTPSFRVANSSVAKGILGLTNLPWEQMYLLRRMLAETPSSGNAQRVAKKQQLPPPLQGFDCHKNLTTQFPISGQMVHHTDFSPAHYPSPSLQWYYLVISRDVYLDRSLRAQLSHRVKPIDSGLIDQQPELRARGQGY